MNQPDVAAPPLQFPSPKPRPRPEPIWPQRLRHIQSDVGRIRLPRVDARNGKPDQDGERCEAVIGGEQRDFRFHDYNEIFKVPGLYEKLFYEQLECCSPSRVIDLLSDVMADSGASLDGLGVLDVGAGNGMVGDELKVRGAGPVVGVDIIPEAREAALRDRPGVYDDYRICDLTDMPEPDEEALRRRRLQVMTLVAALGFGDIPSAAFLKALDLVETPAWIAFNIRDKFLTEKDPTGFAGLIQDLMARGVLQIEGYRRYGHRKNVAGERLYYVGMVARKLKNLPDDLLAK